jgi:hypothetical protein
MAGMEGSIRAITTPFRSHQIQLSLLAEVDSTLSNKESSTLSAELSATLLSPSEFVCGESFSAR